LRPGAGESSIAGDFSQRNELHHILLAIRGTLWVFFRIGLLALMR
jgi:hypothetical protein